MLSSPVLVAFLRKSLHVLQEFVKVMRLVIRQAFQRVYVFLVFARQASLFKSGLTSILVLQSGSLELLLDFAN